MIESVGDKMKGEIPLSKLYEWVGGLYVDKMFLEETVLELTKELNKTKENNEEHKINKS